MHYTVHILKGKELPHYDAFVLYGETEEQFVLEVLVPNLEAQVGVV